MESQSYIIEMKAEGGRFELPDPFGSPIFKTGGFNRSPTPPWRVAEAREIARAGAPCKPSRTGSTVTLVVELADAYKSRGPWTFGLGKENSRAKAPSRKAVFGTKPSSETQAQRLTFAPSRLRASLLCSPLCPDSFRRP